MENRKFANKYAMTEAKEKELWEDCVFVFDTNALLNFYRYPKESRNELFSEIFEKLKDRLWIPAHVKYEFLKNKRVRKEETIKYYSDIKSTYLKVIGEQLKKLKERIDKSVLHPKLNIDTINEFEENFKNFKKEIETEIKTKSKDIGIENGKDIVNKKLEEFIVIGAEYNYDKLLEIVKEGELRMRNKISPGFSDTEQKEGFQRFGDLIIWKQLLEYARVVEKGIVFITDETKQDWWIYNDDLQRNIPRYELFKEFESYSNERFFMYRFDDFVKIGEKLKLWNISIKTNQIVEKIDKVDENIMLFRKFHQWLTANLGKDEKIVAFELDEKSSMEYHVYQSDIIQRSYIVFTIISEINEQVQEENFYKYFNSTTNFNKEKITIVFIINDIGKVRVLRKQVQNKLMPVLDLVYGFDENNVEFGYIEGDKVKFI